jgi:hypothetical protein
MLPVALPSSHATDQFRRPWHGVWFRGQSQLSLDRIEVLMKARPVGLFYADFCRIRVEN